jgi:hypothetical protein
MINELLRRAMDVNQAIFALGNERLEAEGAVFVRNRDMSSMRDANHVAHVTARTPDAIERLLARVEREFADFPHRRFDLDPLTPPEFEARIASSAYQANEMLYMLLEGDLPLPAKQHDVRAIDSDAGWRDYELLNQMDWNEFAEKIEGNQQERWTAQMMFSTPGRATRASASSMTSSPTADYAIAAWRRRSSTPASRRPALAVLAPSPSSPTRTIPPRTCITASSSAPSRSSALQEDCVTRVSFLPSPSGRGGQE